MRRLPVVAPILALGLSLLAVQGCATPPPADDADAVEDYKLANDPLEPTNRVFYAINNGLDTILLAPLARGYRAVVPPPVRTGVHNVLGNLGSPVLLANDMMQGKPRYAGDTLMRFVINSTAGVAGIFDVAKDWGYPGHDNDSGITFALWGLPEGPYLFLPVLGPSNPRDALGFGTDIALDPTTWFSGLGWQIYGYTRYGLSAVDERERHLDDIDQIKKQALDPYATFRSLYRQNRASVIQNAHGDKAATPPIGTAPAQAAPAAGSATQ